jgi:hypothetical protein
MITPRCSRLRDLLLLLVTQIFAILATLLLAGRIWFENLFDLALKGTTVPAAAVFLVLAVAAGVAYVLFLPPCACGESKRIDSVGAPN